MTRANDNRSHIARQSGMTLVELLVALGIGSFLMIGAVQVYNQSRQAFVINESIARVQETAQFAMETLESDLRMASNFGLQSRGLAIEGRALLADPNPLGLPAPVGCGADWALDLARPLEGDNNGYALACAPNGGAQPNSDTITVRRATVAATPLAAGRLQIQSTRIQGALFADGAIPVGFTAADSETHDLLVSSYYVAASSNLIPGVPTLRRQTLVAGGGGPAIADQEVAPGVENIQVQLGVDVDEDNTVDRYVNPGDPIFDPLNAAFIPGSRVITARIWLVVRGVTPETGIQDNANYAPGDVNLGAFNDQFRRMQVSKTILLRNARS
ncbi:MAG: PilW family protein [Gammaproteobacteria bacterium]|nr:PilW family protein [Gammaproteobacteria bacterium]MDH5344781.1 PilW family protein [Gammaproteobacteria bacterium]